MISERCRGRNLLNHCRQVKIPKNISINYIYNKSNYGEEWECVLEFSNKDGELIEFRENGKNKSSVLIRVLDNASSELRNTLSLIKTI